jgi:hypothetical protein
MATTVRWLNAFSTVFVNAPAFNDHNAHRVAFSGANEKSCDVWTKCAMRHITDSAVLWLQTKCHALGMTNP